MVSLEFQNAVKNQNMLHVRIMLKDALIIDPTFSLFDEMLFYAKSRCLDLMQPFDESYLEENSLKWDENLMNEELVDLVTNFSDMRIIHLKNVITKVMRNEIQIIQNKRSSEFKTKEANHKVGNNLYGKTDRLRTRFIESGRKDIARKIRNEVLTIYKVYSRLKDNESWKLEDINEMECAANRLIAILHEYKIDK